LSQSVTVNVWIGILFLASETVIELFLAADVLAGPGCPFPV
jgi:hypothetical protein